MQPDRKAAVGTLALSIVLLAFPAICFYKAFRPVTAFLVVSFQVVLAISSYVAVILLDKVGAGLLDALNWCAGKGMFMSEKTFVIAVKAGTVGILFLQYMAIALLLYFSLKKIVRDFRETDYGISRAELLFILTPAAEGY